jgi:hypothetical protein
MTLPQAIANKLSSCCTEAVHMKQRALLGLIAFSGMPALIYRQTTHRPNIKLPTHH